MKRRTLGVTVLAILLTAAIFPAAPANVTLPKLTQISVGLEDLIPVVPELTPRSMQALVFDANKPVLIFVHKGNRDADIAQRTIFAAMWLRYCGDLDFLALDAERFPELWKAFARGRPDVIDRTTVTVFLRNEKKGFTPIEGPFGPEDFQNVIGKYTGWAPHPIPSLEARC